MRKIFRPPSPPLIAVEQEEIWMVSPALRLPAEPGGLEALRATFLAGKLMGAYAMCQGYGVRER